MVKKALVKGGEATASVGLVVGEGDQANSECKEEKWDFRVFIFIIF